MGLKIENINFELLASEQSLRLDFGFLSYQKNQTYVSEYYTFLELFEFVVKQDVDLSSYNEINYVEIGDISKQGDVNYVQIDLDNRSEILESYYKKIEKGDIISVKRGDILISSIRPNLKKIALIQEENENYFYTKALIHLRPKINSIIAYYLLRIVSFDFINCVSRIGKGYPTLKTEDLKTITFNKKHIDSIIKNTDISNIESILKDINFLIKNQEQESNIINEIFTKELELNIDEFNKIKNTKFFKTPLNEITDNIDLRCSEKFNHPVHKYMLEFLKGKTDKTIKDFLSEPIVLGKTISPKQYEDESDCYYMSMATIKSWYFESIDAKCVSIEYENDNPDKKVLLNDIIIARSGEGSIGKVALIDDEYINAVFADFTMRVRLKNYNYEFAYYFFRSIFFQHLVEYNKKGLGNNTNIFPSQIREFPMLDFSLKTQEEIVTKIKTRILEQQKYIKKIEEKRTEIENLILKSLSI